MSSRAAVRAELMKLARLLGTDSEEIAFLETVAPEDLRALRAQVTELLFDTEAQGLRRLAAASRLLPAGVLASMGEHALGPVLAARIAGLLEPARATEVASKLPTPFLAQSAVYLDPRRAADMLGRIPPERIAEITRELVARGEHVTIGGFVVHLSDEAITLALREMDDLSVMRAAFVVEDITGIERVLELLEPGRVERMIDAARGTEIWPEVLELYGQVREPLRSRVLGSRSPDDAAA